MTERTGFPVGSAACPGEVIFPNGATLEDGLCEEEAVLIALWNNALFQEQLTELGIARGDLIQAGLLPNPEVIYFFPVGEKPFKYAFDLPLEALWLRPIRLKAAVRESARVCDRLTQLALDLIRDVRQGYADVLLAQGRLRVATEGVRVRGGIAQLAATRLKAGDISTQEASLAQIDALQAEQDVLRVRYDVALVEDRLRNLLGLGHVRSPLTLVDELMPPRIDVAIDRLTAEAIATRPDALAAAENAAAAAERLRLAKLLWVRLLGIADATSGRKTGHEFGPAFRVTLPLWNWNQGAIARAEAELERAQRQRQTVRNQIALDVQQAAHRYEQAQSELALVETKVRPQAETAIKRAELAFREGNTPAIVVLETTRQMLDSLLRQQVLQAELRRAWADLERSVGHRLDTPLPANRAEEIPHE